MFCHLYKETREARQRILNGYLSPRGWSTPVFPLINAVDNFCHTAVARPVHENSADFYSWKCSVEKKKSEKCNTYSVFVNFQRRQDKKLEKSVEGGPKGDPPKIPSFSARPRKISGNVNTCGAITATERMRVCCFKPLRDNKPPPRREVNVSRGKSKKIRCIRGRVTSEKHARNLLEIITREIIIGKLS